MVAGRGAAVGGVRGAAGGRRAGPPLALFRALLLAVWHGLSDVRLAETPEDRASFRRFCGFARTEATPERTAFVRFRRELLRHGLDQILFDLISAQLRRRAVQVKTGTRVDASVVGAACRDDAEAGWAGHRRPKAVHGDKV
ncbi:MAG: transposase, partial [Rhodospirillales bacterium]|nr:transposase [Rhodospirillales bacterium]